MSSFSSSSLSIQSEATRLPTRKIPGDYGLPFFGPIKDRFDYFYNQGQAEFFKTRMEKHQSTIFRTNMPPGPFIASNPNVIVLLDAVSFPILFDTTKVEKKNVLDGTFMPSTSFTGGYRMCAYLDPSESNHTKLKQLFMSVLASRHDKVIPLFQHSLTDLFDKLDSEMLEKSNANFNTLTDAMAFDFVFQLLFNKVPKETKLGSTGESSMTIWLAMQLAPLATLGLSFLPNFIEDLFMHTFPLPFFPAKPGYKKIYDVINASSSSILEEAERLGIKREEACHNLVFLAGFNAFGGMKATFSTLIKWIGLAGEKLHLQLADEIRSVVSSEGGLTFSALEKMPLTKSVVYEALRIEPPVPYQYAKAKKDLVIQNHEAAFEIKKGEMLFGYQPFATKDPKVFENPEEFVANRFAGEEGEKLLKYVYWSNGRETENPTVENKQCPGKDMVVLLCRMMVVEFFLRYDTFTVEFGILPLGSSVTVKSLVKASQ